MCRALREQVLAQAGPAAAEGAPQDGMYHGLNNYTDYKKVSADATQALPCAWALHHPQARDQLAVA